MIVVKDLKKNYNGLDVLKGIDLTINKGDVVCLVGPSGCGKSTFLRCLTRLEEPDGGTVMLDGKEITERDIDTTRAQMGDRKSTRLNSSHVALSRMPSSA